MSVIEIPTSREFSGFPVRKNPTLWPYKDPVSVICDEFTPEVWFLRPTNFLTVRRLWRLVLRKG